MILVKKLQTKVRLPAGVYYIGDPYYVFGDNAWAGLCTEYDFSKPKVKLWGQKAFVAPTKLGEGVYVDNLGNVYTVQSGVLGVLPKLLVDSAMFKNPVCVGRHFVEFEKPFMAGLKDEGIFRFGRILIDTTKHWEVFYVFG